MKKVYIFLSLMFLAGHLLSGQTKFHWTSTGNPLNGLTLSWASKGAADTIRWGYTPSFEQGKFPGKRKLNYSGYWYDYTFPVVMPSATIHYSILKDSVWIPEKIFRTSADTTSAKFSFIAGGDSRTNINDWDAAAKKLDSDSADFMLFLGDHIATGSDTAQWNNWFSRGAEFLENNLIYHTAGNHEYGSIYLNQFEMPGNNEWYSFETGDALFVCLLSQNNFTVQHTWLLDVLSKSTKKWKVIFFHKPFFTTGGHTNDMNSYRSTWWKAFDDYGVDIVLGGHTHYYLRSKPVNLNISSTEAVAEYGSKPWQGRLQVVSGSIGAPRASVGSAWFIEKNFSTMNYSKFIIDGDIMKMNSYDISGNLLDSLTINKLLTGINDSETDPAVDFKLVQNYPNPFSVSTTIMYHLTKADNISLKIFDITGQVVETLVQGLQPAGDYKVTWQPGNLKSGVYFYRLEALNPSAGLLDRSSQTKKLILLK
jgi:predicted phosphodiesterase